MKSLTYFARVSEERDPDPANDCCGFSVLFPDLPFVYTCAESRDEAIAKAKIELEDCFNLAAIGELSSAFAYPSTLKEILDEADSYWDVENFGDEKERDYVRSCELSCEFVPISVTPPNGLFFQK